MPIFDNQLSIILPIKDRKAYTLRVLDYLNNEKCKYEIFIADGSKIKNFKQALLNNKFKNLNLTYKYHGHDKTFTKFLNKIYSYRYFIKSEYIYWLCDDDFPNLETLKHGINKLLKNKNFSTYIGQVKNFTLSNQKLEFNNKFQYYYPSATKRTFLSNNILSKIKKYNQFHPFEAIINTSVFFRVFKESKILKVDNFHEFALIFKTIPLLYGKIFIESKLILIRQTNSYISEGKKNNNFFEDELALLLKVKFKKIVNKLADIINKKFHLKKHDKEIVINIYYNNFLEIYNYTLKKNLSSLKNNKFYKLFKILKKSSQNLKIFKTSGYVYEFKNSSTLFHKIKKKLLML